jgi:hypothetical protein
LEQCVGLAVVDERKTACEFAPGMQAPAAGVYEQRNVLGSFTGVRVTVGQGDVLPAAPRGFTWSIVKCAGGQC